MSLSVGNQTLLHELLSVDDVQTFLRLADFLSGKVVELAFFLLAIVLDGFDTRHFGREAQHEIVQHNGGFCHVVELEQVVSSLVGCEDKFHWLNTVGSEVHTC